MSIVQDLRTRARHRGLKPFQLIQKIGRLERENDSLACQLVGLTTEIGEFLAERNQLEQQLDTAGIELSGARDDLTAQEAELAALRAFKANVLSVSDLGAQDGPIAPAPTVTRFDTGPVRRLGSETVNETTQPVPVLNPGQTSWGARREHAA